MSHRSGTVAGALCRRCEEDGLVAEVVKAEREREWEGYCPVCGEPLRSDGGCQRCDEDRAKRIPFAPGALFTILLICFPAFGQSVISGRGVYLGDVLMEGQAGGGFYAAGENAYCAKGAAPEMTNGAPTWGTSDGVALLPTQCMYTGMDATPSPGSVITAATSAALTSALASVSCGETIQLTAGAVYTGPFTFPALGCNGSQWITVESSGVSNSNFPPEHTQATPCIAGISNDGTHGYNEPGYPTYACPSYPTVLTAQITSSSVNQGPMQFAPGATHYRFIGIEVTKNPTTIMGGGFVMLTTAGYNGPGSDHIIFDRSFINGPSLTVAAQTSGDDYETQEGIYADNSQYIALINSWDIDTYCTQVCIDSQAYHGGTGFIQDGPHKLYDNVLSSAGETWLFGGGGQGPGSPNTTGLEIRGNLSMKPLLWMIPINSCVQYPYYAQVKNLGELKNSIDSIYEGNTETNSWQGCQENQAGYANLVDPKNQNDKSSVNVNFDGVDGLVQLYSSSAQCNGTSGQCFANACGGGLYCNVCGGSGSTPTAAAAAGCHPAGSGFNPDYPCPPGGCILYINDPNRQDFTTQYRYCDGINGCYQTSDGTASGTPLNLTTEARILPYAGSYPQCNGQNPCSDEPVYTCVPGLDPTAAIHNFTMRFNLLENLTNGVSIGTGKAAYCEDESAGADTMEFHDNLLEGLSIEMSNSTGPYEATTGFGLTNGQMGAVINTVELSHNDVIQEDQAQSIGGFGFQLDNTDVQYLQGFNIHDNVGTAPWVVQHSQGSLIGAGGVGGLTGLANIYQTDACQAVYANDANNDLQTGIVQNPNGVAAGTAFTFTPPSGMGTDYFATKNGQYSAITNQTSSGFTLTASLAQGDSFTVRNLTSCNWTFTGNILGEGLPGLIGGLQPPAGESGSGKPQDPYPSTAPDLNGNNTDCGTGGALACILTNTSFTGIFTNWATRNGTALGNYAISAGSGYQGTAQDGAARQAKGLATDPGIDVNTFSTVTAASAAMATSIFYYPLSFSSTTLTLNAGNNYQGLLMTLLGSGGVVGGYGASGGGASPYKSWWGNSAVAPGGSGIILGRDGTIDGPFWVQTVSRSVTSCGSAGTVACSSFNVAMNWDANTTPAVGQTIYLSGFTSYGTGNQQYDSTFNGTCVIQTVSNTGTVTCAQPGTGQDTIASHTPISGKNCATQDSYGWYRCSSLTFWPLTAQELGGSGGSYSFSVNAKDGAFQQATANISLTVN